MRARLLPHETEQNDEELAALAVVGVDVLRFTGWFYRKIAKVPGLEGKILTALDTGGYAALVELLAMYHLDEPGKYWRPKDELKDAGIRRTIAGRHQLPYWGNKDG